MRQKGMYKILILQKRALRLIYLKNTKNMLFHFLLNQKYFL
jgi:hypothetical protein